MRPNIEHVPMRRHLHRAIALLAAATLGPGLALAEPARDEAKATRFVQCGYLTQFWFEHLTKNDPSNPSLSRYAVSRTGFLVAAALLSDERFVRQGQQAGARNIVDIAREQERTQTPLLAREAARCLAVFEQEAKAILHPSSPKELG